MQTRRTSLPLPREMVEALRLRTPSASEFLRECMITIAECEPEPIDNMQVSFAVPIAVHEKARSNLRGRMTLAAALRLMVVDFVEKTPPRQEDLENYIDSLNKREKGGKQ